MPSQIADVLHLSMGLLAVWFLIFFCVPEYRVDKLRQELFALRDELFDFATDGGLTFDSPAYGLLRNTFNGLIRFGHRISFLRLLITLVMQEFHPELRLDTPYRRWTDAVAALSESQKARLMDIHNRMGKVLIRHLVWGSPILLLFAVLHRIFSIARAIVRRSDRERLSSRLPVQVLEVQALEEQERLLGIQTDKDERLTVPV